MTTASQAIKRIAEAAGILPATVFRVARTLREAGGDLWPQGSQGRGRAAHVQPHHLVNVALALLSNDSTTNAVANLSELRAVIPYSNGQNFDSDSYLGQILEQYISGHKFGTKISFIEVINTNPKKVNIYCSNYNSIGWDIMELDYGLVRASKIGPKLMACFEEILRGTSTRPQPLVPPLGCPKHHLDSAANKG